MRHVQKLHATIVGRDAWVITFWWPRLNANAIFFPGQGPASTHCWSHFSNVLLKPNRRRTHAQEKRTHAMTFAELFLVGRLAVSKIISKQGASDYTSAPGAGPQGESDGNARLCYSTSFG